MPHRGDFFVRFVADAHGFAGGRERMGESSKGSMMTPLRNVSLHGTLTLVLASSIAACIGSIGDGDAAREKDPGAHDGVLNGDPSRGDPKAAGALQLRRLGGVEYLNTVRDLFGEPTLAIDLPPDPLGSSGFTEAPLVSDTTADDLRGAAETLAARAVQSFDSFFACDTAKTGEDACVEQFVRRFGRRAYRRTVEDEEVHALMGLYHSARTTMTYGMKDAVRLVVTAMLQSPRFLYHWELGAEPLKMEGDVARLSPFTLASRLSYFLWATMPDDALLDAAASGALDSDTELGKQVDRLLKSERFVVSATQFHTEWLGLDAHVSKDPTLFPEYGDAFANSAREEMRRFVRHVFVEGDGRWETLLTSPVADVDATLAKLYGVTVKAGADGFGRVTLDPATRGGLLTRAALITVDTDASQTNPPRAGKLVWSKILCKTIDPPPPGAAASFHFDKGLSTRENFDKLATQPACASCHGILNPIGFAFEHYDAVGRYRTMEGPHTVDSSGSYVSATGTKSFGSVVDMSRALATDADATSCIAKTWFRYAVRRLETDKDVHSLEGAFGSFKASSFDIRAFLTAVTTSRTFRYRALEAGEVVQ